MLRIDLILVPVCLIFLFIKTKQIIYILIYLFIFREYSLVIFISIFCFLFAFIFNQPSIFRFGVNILFYKGFNLTHNFEDIPNQPCIIVSNYNSKRNIVDYCANCIFPVKTVLFVNSKLFSIIVPRLYEKDRYYIFPSELDNFNIVETKIKEYISKGYHVFVYVERHVQTKKYLKNIKIAKEINKTPMTISCLRQGIFQIAHNLKIPILPVVMSSIRLDSLFITEKNFQIKIGTLKYVDNVEETINEVFYFMKKNLRLMRLNSL